MQSRRGEKLASFIVGSEHCPVRHTPASTRVLTQFYSETRPLVNGFKGNKHKSFRTVDEAEEYLRQDNTSDTEVPVTDQPRRAEPRGVSVSGDALCEPETPHIVAVQVKGDEKPQERGTRKPHRRSGPHEKLRHPVALTGNGQRETGS